MATNNRLNLKSKAQNPDTEFDVRAQGRSFPTVGLNSNEAQILDDQVNSFMAGLTDSSVLEVYQQNADAVSLTASFAKQVFDEKLFGGVNAGDNEIAFDVLRPGHIRSSDGNDEANPSASQGDAVNNWYYEPSSEGWNDWIGDGTSSGNYMMGEDQISVVFGVIDQDTSSEVSGLNVESFGRNVDMIPKDLNDMRLRDNDSDLQVAQLPTLIAQENDEVHIRLKHDRKAESQPRLLGFTFGLGTHMNTEEY